MARRTTVGIDVGTHQVRVVVAEQTQGGSKSFPKILGTGVAQSKGLRHGYIINQSDVARALTTAIRAAEQSSGIPIRSAYLSVGGVGLDEVRSRAEIAVGRADQEVSDIDVNAVIEASEKRATAKLTNRKVIHVIPLLFRLDGIEIMGRPQGMKGVKLEVETLFITTLEQHLQDLIGTVEDVGVAVTDVMASPLAGSFVTVSKAQKMAGCVVANIGSETVSIVVFEETVPQSVKVFPIGSSDITNDIALGLRISLDDAEQVKRGALIGSNHSRKQLDDIIASRLSDIFDLVEAHLEKIGKSGSLPAGVIITGGGSGIATIEDIARASLKLPSRKASLAGFKDPKIKDASWAVAYGLTIWGLSTEEESFGLAMAKQAGANIIGWVKQFLP